MLTCVKISLKSQNESQGPPREKGRLLSNSLSNMMFKLKVS